MFFISKTSHYEKEISYRALEMDTSALNRTEASLRGLVKLKMEQMSNSGDCFRADEETKRHKVS